MIVPLLPGVTALSAVHLFPDATQQGEATVLTPTFANGVWTLDLIGIPAGRYWPRIHGTRNGSPFVYAYPDVVLDLPIDDRLVITPEALAASAKVPLPLTPDQRLTIVEVILDAQADVEAHLNRPIVPREFVDHHLDDYGDTWQVRANEGDPIVRVLSVVPETGDYDGLFTVTYLSGLDAKSDPALRPIRRYVMAHAKNGPEFTDLWIEATGAVGEIKSLSAEGQSVTYAKASLNGGAVSKPGDGSPGALPTLGSLDYWRKRSVYQGRTRWWEPVP